MAEEFTVDYRLNEGFDRLVALNIALEGAGSALIVSSVLSYFPPGIVAGLVLVAVGIVFLFFHLGNRLKFWRVLAGLKNAWISRGALFAGGLVCFGILSIVVNEGLLGLAVQVVTVLFGLLTILYSGLLLSSMTPIPFWNTPFTPVLFLLHSAVTGMAVFMFMTGQSDKWTGGILVMMIAMMGLTLTLTIIHIMVMANSTNAAQESVRLLLKDGFKGAFLGGAVVAGLLIPLIMFSYIYMNMGQSTQYLMILLGAVVLRFIGDYAFRASILNAGVFELMI